ncbi:MarR family winged helix-turn-helix transcriptional regulator [Streptomyces longisporoflavus]|uniref:MarR family winged helix-turn-helix transcriptional regulator n=1 Tax=Streptomyces longisporoflavus TaxID=28044 RepID=A0ABW7R370_9ACTN
MHDTRRVANLLGATALALVDGTLNGISGTTGLSGSSAAALVVLAGSPGLGGTELGRRIGLTQSAAARLVDSLQAAGLAERSPGEGRHVSVTLTSEGRSRARSVLEARGGTLDDAVSALDAAEQAQLASLLDKLLTRLFQGADSAHRMCRLCDRAGCVSGAVCPVGQAERDSRAGE